VAGREAPAFADRLDHVAAEALVGHRVADDADVRLLPDAHDGRLRELAHVFLVLFPAERERQEIARLPDLEQRQQPADAAARHVPADVPPHVPADVPPHVPAHVPNFPDGMVL
jgi:hypothetical protein